MCFGTLFKYKIEKNQNFNLRTYQAIIILYEYVNEENNKFWKDYMCNNKTIINNINMIF